MRYKFFTTADVIQSQSVIDLKNIKKKVLASMNDEISKSILAIPLDVDTWLPQASKIYKISSNFNDYIVVPVVIFLSDLPNRNGVAFPLRELIKFNPELGMLAYKSWKAKPTFEEHKNDILSDAKGVIFDSIIEEAPDFEGNLVKVTLLLGFDKTKDPILCNKILRGERDSYSMGAYCEDYTCSVCNKKVSKGGCEHININKPEFKVVNDNLCFANVEDLCGFECSSVETPAFVTAVNKDFVEVSKV